MSLYHSLSLLVQICQGPLPGPKNVFQEVRPCSQTWIPGAHPVNGEETAFKGMRESWGEGLKRWYWKASSSGGSLFTQYGSLFRERELSLQTFWFEIHDEPASALKTNLPPNQGGRCRCVIPPTRNRASVWDTATRGRSKSGL